MNNHTKPGSSTTAEQSVRRVLVATNGPEDDPVIRLACDYAKRHKAEAYVVYVIEVKRTLPIDADIESETARGEDLLSSAEQIAEEMDFEVQTDLLQAREAGPALVEEAVERGVDVIVMGIAYRSKLGDFYIGAVASYVLKHAPCQVWLIRAPMDSSPH